MNRLADRILAGERRAAARLMRLLDDEQPAAIAELKRLYPRVGRAAIIGITGSPGSGKSTLTNRMIASYRAQGKTVGVVAIDPTSPFSGGAILGDRIRMRDHEADEGVFVRSLATRGNLGGLSRSTRDVVAVFDAMGTDVVIIETVGVGQDEVDIVGTAHSSLVVLVPGMGDDIQAIKAGILEIADIFVLNKCDREGAERTEREIKMMIELGGGREGWKPPIARTVAVRDEGVAELVARIEEHRAWMIAHGELVRRKRWALEAAFWAAVDYRLGRSVRAAVSARMPMVVDDLLAGRTDPYSAAEQAVALLAQAEAAHGA